MGASDDPLSLVIAAGGTGGHLFPALAVAQQTRLTVPRARIVFVGAHRGLETDLVPRHGFELRSLTTGRLKGTRWRERLRTLAGLTPALLRASALLGELRADVVLGAGGYASAPIVLAAALRRVPVVLLEQNAVPGLTNRLLARFASRVVTALPDVRQLLPRERTIELGNPLRPELVARLRGCAEQRALASPRRLLVLGGSQGAHAVNRLLVATVPLLEQRLGRLLVRHQTGTTQHGEVDEAYRSAGVDAQVEPFIEDMAAAYCEADLMIGRSGATTLAELAVAGLPAVLIPYPHAADDHQTANALELVRAGGALMECQDRLDPERLAQTVGDLLEDAERLAQMSCAMRARARPRAAAAVVDLLLELA